MRSFCCLLLAVYLMRYAIEDLNSWYIDYGLSLNGVLTGKLWQPFTYALLHGSWFHLAMNVIPVYFLARCLERWVGGVRMFFVLVAGCLLGGVGHLCLSLCFSETDQSILVGLSGGLMAVLICICYLRPYSYLWKLPIRLQNLGTGMLVSSLLLALMHPSLELPMFAGCGLWMSEMAGEEFFRVSHTCHFFGGLAGWLATYFLKVRKTAI